MPFQSIIDDRILYEYSLNGYPNTFWVYVITHISNSGAFVQINGANVLFC